MYNTARKKPLQKEYKVARLLLNEGCSPGGSVKLYLENEIDSVGIFTQSQP